jgi:hypothetical protein
LFYPALSALLCEGFQPGSVLSQTTAASSSSFTSGSITHLEDNVLFQYSLAAHESSVRCAKILYSLIVRLSEDVFSLSDLIHAVPARFHGQQQTVAMKHRHHQSATTASATNLLLSSFTHHITALPEMEAQVHSLQRRARHINLKKTNELPPPTDDGTLFTPSGDSFAERLEVELASHIELVTSKLLTALYRHSNHTERKMLRNKLGSILIAFSHTSNMISSSSSTSAVLGERNTSAAAIPGILFTLHRIICGFRAPPLHESHKSLLLNILLPLHKVCSPGSSGYHSFLFYEIFSNFSSIEFYHLSLTHCLLLLIISKQTNAMVLWRDQEALLGLYHLPLVMCISKLLDFDSETLSPLISKVIMALLHPNVWPEGRTSNTPKVVLLLHEIDTLLERHPSQCGSDLRWFKTVGNSLVLRLCECISGENSRVAERALQMWKNDKLEDLVASQLSTCLAPLLQALCRVNSNMEPSWNPTVNKMTALVLRKLEERDPELFVRTCNEVLGGLQTTQDDNEEPQQLVAHDLDPSEISTFQPLDTSLKSAMGSWKPPARRKPGTVTGSIEKKSSTPPSIVTGIAPWATQQKGDSGSISSRFNSSQSQNPPLAITGVAPWAVSEKSGMKALNPLPQPVDAKNLAVNKMGNSSSTDLVKGQDKTLGIMKLREFVRKISPLSEEGAGGETESSHLSSWAVAQLSESPMLLPDLKFHDLVFGHELGSGAFSTVKYARRIIKTLTRSLWPEYAVKVRCNLVVPFPLE